MITAPGIYAVVVLPTGGIYIGSSTNVSMRLSRHKADLVKGVHYCGPLLHAFQSNNSQLNNLVFSIIELTTRLKEREQYWLEYYKASGALVYNQYDHSGSRERVPRETSTAHRRRSLL